jgi:hypothetical protein
MPRHELEIFYKVTHNACFAGAITITTFDSGTGASLENLASLAIPLRTNWGGRATPTTLSP